MLNRHTPHPDRLVGVAAGLMMDGLEKGWTFSVVERDGAMVVEMTAKPGTEMPEGYRLAVNALADEVAYLVK